MFRTYEPSRDRLVAVKAFRLDLLPEQAAALADELRALAGRPLGHRSIIARIAAGLEGHVVYLAEEYVAAESLDIAVRHYAPASLDTVLPYIRQLAGAIDLARDAGVGHGALHPRDIYLTPEEARATGFGVVDALERLDLRAPVRRPYSPPERVAGEPWSTPADVFALGAVAYELLTGRRPAGTVETAPLADAAVGAHPDRVAAVLARALAEEPGDRYSTALDLADALERAARGEGEPVGRGAPVEPRLALVIGSEEGAEPTEEFGAPAEGVDEEEPVTEEPEETDGYTGAETHLDLDEHETDVPSLLDFVEPAQALENGRPSSGAVTDGAGGPHLWRPADGTQEGEERKWESGSASASLQDEASGRSPFLPYAGTLVIGLLLGFLAGYGLGSREAASGTPAGDAPAASTPATPGPGGTEKQTWSEEAVEPKAPAPATPAAPAAEGRLLVRSMPSGAEVRVNGTPRGTTPLTLGNLALGSYEVEVRREGYVPTAQQVVLSAGLPEREMVFPLRSAGRVTAPSPSRPTAPPRATAPPERPARPAETAGILVADTRPRGARVLVDGQPVGTTPLRLPGVAVGRHQIRFELEGYRPWTTEITVAGGQEHRVSGSLEPEGS